MSPFRSAEQSRLRTAAAAREAPDASSASAAMLRVSALRHSGVRQSAPRSCFSPDCARGRPPRSTHALLPSGGGVHRWHPASWLASKQRHGRVSLSSSTSSSIAPTSSSAAGSPACAPPLPPPPPPSAPRTGGLQLSSWSVSPRLRVAGANQQRCASAGQSQSSARERSGGAALCRAATPLHPACVGQAPPRDGLSSAAARCAAAQAGRTRLGGSMNEHSNGSCAAAYPSAAPDGPGIDAGAWPRMASATLSSVQHSPGGVCSASVAAYDDVRFSPGVPRARQSSPATGKSAHPG